MKIKYIDGKRFRWGIKAGAQKVYDNQDYLNDINAVSYTHLTLPTILRV